MEEDLGQNTGLAFERGQIVASSISLILGGVIGWAIPELIADPKQLPFWILLISSILLFISISFSMGLFSQFKRENSDTLGVISKNIGGLEAVSNEVLQLVETSIGQQASLIPRANAYKAMAKSIDEAKNEVAAVTYLMANWEEDKRNFVPAEEGTPHRNEYYEAVSRAIDNPNVQYKRIWQVPDDHISKARELIDRDPKTQNECVQIEAIQSERPDKARLIIAGQITFASFVLIDNSKLFFNVDVYHPIKKRWYSPYMLFIKDAEGEAFEALQSVIARLETSPKG